MDLTETKKNKKLRSNNHLIAHDIIIVEPENRETDTTVIKNKYYNALNPSILPKQYQKFPLAIGVTSANKGEGKTLTAANLAVSFSMSGKKTVLIDMNTDAPSLHKVFGSKLYPGLTESFQNGRIFLSRAAPDHLFLLAAGKPKQHNGMFDTISSWKKILGDLKKNFDVIIADMNPVLPIDHFPAVYMNDFDGLLMVIDAHHTRYPNVEQAFKHIRRDQTVGFVLNRSA